ncbi:MAG: L,D-transpeptidase [Thermoanaerobaculia bacterium]
MRASATKYPRTLVGGLTAWLLLVWSGQAGGQVSPDPAPPEPRYRAVEIQGDGDLTALLSELGDEGMRAVWKINRRDDRHVRRGDVLIMPEEPGAVADHSPFPVELSRAASLPKLILVSLRVQAFAAYEHGVQALWGPVNSGSQKFRTPPTLYHVNWRTERRASSLNPSWIMHWVLNIHTGMGLALHHYAMPGYPASHGCIRLLRDDAVWLYDWAELWSAAADGQTAAAFGTPVVVFENYDYDSPRPWMGLAEDPLADRITEQELDEMLDRYLPAMERRSRERQDHLASHQE